MTDTETKSNEREVTIKHGVFYYHEEVPRIIAGEEKKILVERLAFHGETVNLARAADIERGDEVGAFYSDDELKELGPRQQTAAEAHREALEAAGDGETTPVSEMDEEDLVDWLMSTGEFDGKKKPTAAEVNAAIGDDPELAARVLEAEDVASGGNPRKAIVDHVESLGDED